MSQEPKSLASRARACKLPTLTAQTRVMLSEGFPAVTGGSVSLYLVGRFTRRREQNVHGFAFHLKESYLA